MHSFFAFECRVKLSMIHFIKENSAVILTSNEKTSFLDILKWMHRNWRKHVYWSIVIFNIWSFIITWTYFYKEVLTFLRFSFSDSRPHMSTSCPGFTPSIFFVDLGVHLIMLANVWPATSRTDSCTDMHVLSLNKLFISFTFIG